MKINNATYEGGKLILDTKDVKAKQFVYKFKQGDYEIKKVRKKRSLDANAYCWSLCSQIADVVGISKEEVYRNAIRDGNQYTALTVHPNAVQAFARAWSTKGLGWTVEAVDEDTDSVLMLAYYGSSAYDTKQMAALIDRLVQDAKALDIDVMSEQERSLLLENWQ